jgi:hypothetical protein
MCQSPHFHLSCSSPYLYLVVLCLECHFQSFFVGKSTHNSLINSVVRWRVNLRIWANNTADKNVVPMTNASASHIFFLLRKTNKLKHTAYYYFYSLIEIFSLSYSSFYLLLLCIYRKMAYWQNDCHYFPCIVLLLPLNSKCLFHYSEYSLMMFVWKVELLFSWTFFKLWLE